MLWAKDEPLEERYPAEFFVWWTRTRVNFSRALLSGYTQPRGASSALFFRVGKVVPSRYQSQSYVMVTPMARHPDNNNMADKRCAMFARFVDLGRRWVDREPLYRFGPLDVGHTHDQALPAVAAQDISSPKWLWICFTSACVLPSIDFHAASKWTKLIASVNATGRFAGCCMGLVFGALIERDMKQMLNIILVTTTMLWA